MPEMTPDEMKALIAEARERAYAPTPTEGLIRRLADALEAALSAHPAEETGWEIKWAPVLRDGYEWAIRDEAECDVLIEEYADPAHWIYEDYNDDLEPVVGKRAYRRRKAGPWESAPTDGDGTP